MAVAFGDEGEGECAATGMPVLVREWRDEEQFEVCEFSVALSHCVDAIQLEVSALPPTDHRFKGVFDDDGLAQAGFGHSVSFPNRLKIIRRALTGDSAVATLKADGRDLNLEIKVPMFDFETDFKLPLKREQLSESDAKLLKAEARVAEMEAESQARVVETHKIIEELMEASKVMESELATTKAQLSSTAGDCESAKRQLAAAKLQILELMESTKATEYEIRVRDKRIAELESKGMGCMPPPHLTAGYPLPHRSSAFSRDAKARKSGGSSRPKKKKWPQKDVGGDGDDEFFAETRYPPMGGSGFSLRYPPPRGRPFGGVPKSALTTAGTREPLHFRFHATLKKGATDPSFFQVSTDGKTATGKFGYWRSQLLLTPAVANGTHSVVFRLEKMGLFGASIGVGVTDDCGKWMYESGCMFHSNGSVKVKNETVTKSSPFSRAHMHKGDEIKLVVDLDIGEVSIEVPNGHCTAEWKPRTGRRTWIGFQTAGGISLTIV